MRSCKKKLTNEMLYNLMMKNIEELCGLARVISDDRPSVENRSVFELMTKISQILKLYEYQK